MTKDNVLLEVTTRIPGLENLNPSSLKDGSGESPVLTPNTQNKLQGANRRLSLPQEVRATSHQSIDAMIDNFSPICPRRKSFDLVDEPAGDPIHDDYRIGKTLGKGSYARVKLGLHIRTQEKVAIKIIEKAGLSEKDNDTERLMREIVILKGLRHPYICQLYEVINTKDRIYLVLEHLTGGELFDYIVALRRVKEKPARDFFRQIVAAMDFCHSQDIIHRDLKPENLLLDENGKIKIIDFGFSNTFDRTELLDTFCGSPAYAAPEMIAGRAYSGAASDVWSLGVILFAVVCGYLPFDHENTSKMYALIAKGEYTCPDYLSEGVKDLIAKMLRVDPKDRAAMSEVRTDPWLNEGYDSLPVKVTNEPRPVDMEIVDEMIRLGYDREILLESLDVDECNTVTAAYNLLFDKKLRQPKATDVKVQENENQSSVNHTRRNTVQGVPVVKLQSMDYAMPKPVISPPSDAAAPQSRRSNHRRQSETGDLRAPRIHLKVSDVGNTLDIVAEEMEYVDIKSAESRRRPNPMINPNRRTSHTPEPISSRERTQSVDSPVTLTKKSFRTRLREWIVPGKGSNEREGKEREISGYDGLKVAKNQKTFNSATVSSLPPKDIMDKLIKVLDGRGTTYFVDRQQWRITCDENPMFKGNKRKVKYDVELSRIKALDMNGVSFKRVQGHLWVYKQVCDDITAKLFL